MNLYETDFLSFNKVGDDFIRILESEYFINSPSDIVLGTRLKKISTENSLPA